MSVEARRQFVDTNVLVYAYDATAGVKGERARALIADLWRSAEGCLSLQVLQEFFVTVTRKVARPIPATRVEKLVADLSRWTLHAPGREDLLAAIELHRQKKISLWDALILRSARQLGCETLWSEDLNAGQAFDRVKIRNPFV
jgi:predicted nucleic acid-binding protein